MSEDSEQGKPKAQIVGMKSIESRSSADTFTLKETFSFIPWSSFSFAQDWFEDALREAQTGKGHNSRRREIVFAVCCVESYLIEWLRDDVLKRKFDSLPRYFPPGVHRGIRPRWKGVICKAYSDKLICNMPDFGKPYWEEFDRLVQYRNGLVHGNSSRPVSVSLEQKERPEPSKVDLSKGDLDELESGWAVRVVTDLIRQLHDDAGTSAPKWLVGP